MGALRPAQHGSAWPSQQPVTPWRADVGPATPSAVLHSSSASIQQPFCQAACCTCTCTCCAMCFEAWHRFHLASKVASCLIVTCFNLHILSCRAHSIQYVEMVEAMSEDYSKGIHRVGDESAFMPGGFQVAALAAGGAVAATEAVLEGQVTNAYVLCR